MKDLDRNKKYDLSKLNDEQLQNVLDWLKENDIGWDSKSIEVFKPDYLYHPLAFLVNDFKLYDVIDASCVNALELFEDTIHIRTVGRENQETTITQDIKNLIEKGKQQGLKVVVTFE